MKAIAQGETLEAAPPKVSATAVVPDAAPAPPAAESDRPVGVVATPLPDPLPQQQ